MCLRNPLGVHVLIVLLLQVQVLQSVQRETEGAAATATAMATATATATTTTNIVDSEPRNTASKTVRETPSKRTIGNPNIGKIWSSARNFLCLPLLRIFSLELRQPLQPGDHVGITGNHATLGAWRVNKSLKMNPKDGSGLRWYLRVPICTNKRIEYRYFIYHIDRRGVKRIRWWEAIHYARVIEHYMLYRSKEPDVFGRVYKITFGEVEQERGWLRGEYQVELKFIWKHHMRWYRTVDLAHVQRVRLKLLQLSADGANDNDNEVEVARYGYMRAKYRQQPSRGVPYERGDIVMFRLTAPLRTYNTYQLVISNQEGYSIGEVLILPMDLHDNEGVLDLPIHSALDGFQIGQLRLPYTIIQPLPNAMELNFRAGFHHYWPMNWPTLDVGHRGSGKSFYQSYAAQVENTIESFLYVGRLKGDMVHMDVQFTKDYVPVLWHDFGFYTLRKGKPLVDALELQYVYIRDLTYRRLKRKRVFVMKGTQVREYTHLNVRSTTVLGRIFPQLADVFVSLPKTLGLNLDVKWPQLLQSGALQAHETLDKNHVANVLIQITARYACGRPLIFSSFDADLCTMLRYKQNVFPVMFSTTGKSALWEPYMDLRTQTFLNAVNFAESANLLGTAAHVEDILQNEKLLDMGTDLAQVVFVWGDDLQSANVIENFRRLFATGIIYDRMDLYGPIKKRWGFFTAPELVEIFDKQCEAIGNLSSIREIPSDPFSTNMTRWPTSKIKQVQILQIN